MHSIEKQGYDIGNDADDDDDIAVDNADAVVSSREARYRCVLTVSCTMRDTVHTV